MTTSVVHEHADQSAARDTGAATPRRPRRPRSLLFVLLTALMIGFVLTGFWPYFGHILTGTVHRPWVIHLHAAVFSGWMVLFTTQVLLVLWRRTTLHRKLGRIGIAYGVLVLLMGLAAGFAAPVLHYRAGEWTLDRAGSFLLLPLGDMLLFGTLFAAGITYRKTPEIHRRLMLLATVALMYAPVSRFTGKLIDRAGVLGVPLFLVIWLFPALLGMAHDLWTRHRIHRAYVIGTLVLLAVIPRAYWMERPSWLRIGRAVVAALAHAPSHP